MLLHSPIFLWPVSIVSLLVAGEIAYLQLRDGLRSHVPFAQDREDGRERDGDGDGAGREEEKRGGELV